MRVSLSVSAFTVSVLNSSFDRTVMCFRVTFESELFSSITLCCGYPLELFYHCQRDCVELQFIDPVKLCRMFYSILYCSQFCVQLIICERCIFCTLNSFLRTCVIRATFIFDCPRVSLRCCSIEVTKNRNHVDIYKNAPFRKQERYILFILFYLFEPV